MDRDGKAVWTRRIDGEYAALPEGWRWSDLVERGVQQLDASPAAVGITSYADGRRTAYAIEKDGAGAWSARETGTKEAKPAEHAPGPAPLAITPGEFRDLGSVTLGTPGPAGVIDSISGICFDGRGRIGWVRWIHGDKPVARFTLVDREGLTVADIPLDFPEAASTSIPQPARLEGDRWVVARTVYGQPSTAQAWFFAAATGKLTPIEGFTGGSINRVCRAPDGGFFVLNALHGNYTIRDQVTRYDRDGKVLSSKTEPGYGQGDSIHDIAVLDDGTLAALTSRALDWQIKLLRPGKEEPEVWSLSEIIGAAKGPEQSYIADVRADKDNGLIVYDSANQNHLHRIDKNGKCWQSFHVRGPKGETFRLYDQFAVDPEGRVWASDHSRLYRCDETGTADLALGGPPEGAMADPVAVTIDRAGRVYALEKGTAAVHVFDDQGKPIRVMRPEPTDTPTQDALAWIRVEADGRVRYRMTYEGPIVTFDADGRRIGIETPPEPWQQPDTPRWEPVDGGGWETSGQALRRVGPDGAPIRTIEHRPDGAWLVSVMDAAAAPDGSVAVLCGRETPGEMFGFGSGPAWLCVYGPDGEGRGVVPLDRASVFLTLRWDGRRLLLCDEHAVTAFDLPLSPRARRFMLPGEKSYWSIMKRPDGTLAAWDHGSRTIVNLALPD